MVLIFVHRPVVFNYRGRGGATLKVIFLLHSLFLYIELLTSAVFMILLKNISFD